MNNLKIFITYLLLIPILAIPFLMTGCPPIDPGAPINVQATDGEYEDMVKVTWNPVYYATSYKVYRSNSEWIEYNMFFELLPKVTETTFIDDTVNPDEIYYYKVKAFSTNDTSGEFSDLDTGFASGSSCPLTIDEFYNDVYMPVINYIGKKTFPLGSDYFPGDEDVIEGDESGTCTWKVYFNPDFSVTNEIIFEDYNDGDIGISNNESGLTLNGSWTILTNTSGDGMSTGLITITDSHEALVDYHLVITGKVPVADPDPETGSWTSVTYCDETKRFYYGE